MVNHIITQDQFIWVGDAPTSRLLQFDLNGNLFLADCFAGRPQKFEPLPGTDPSKLMGQILRYPVAQPGN